MCKAKFFIVDKNEFSDIRSRIEAVSNTLKKYDVDKLSWSQCFQRNKILRNMHYTLIMSQSTSQYSPCIYICQDVHLYSLWSKRICLDFVLFNITNKNIWIRKNTNPQGPKKIWVPKSILVSLDASVSSLKMWENWCLDSGCFSKLNGQI